MENEDLLLELLKIKDYNILRYTFLIRECPLIQDKLAVELYDDKIQKIVKENLKEISIKLVETIKLLNNTEMTKNINELNEEEKKKIIKRLENIFKK